MKKFPRNRPTAPPRERGAVLVIMLLLLLMVTVLGVSLMRMQTAEQRIAVNHRNRSTAAANTEAVLRFAECGLQGACAGAAWAPSSFLQNTAGLYSLNPATGSTVSVNLANTATSATWQSPGSATIGYTGVALPAASTPQYVIEKLPPVMLPGDSMRQEQYNGGGGATPYQVTAYANGADGSSRSVMQSTFRP